VRLVKAVEKLKRQGADRGPGRGKRPPKVSFDWLDVDGIRQTVKTLACVWSEQEDRLGRELAEGESLAIDLHVAMPGGTVSIVRAVERATLDPEDRGRVVASGQEIGRILDVRGQLLLVGWRADAESEGGAGA
jgi:hypothetical protein